MLTCMLTVAVWIETDTIRDASRRWGTCLELVQATQDYNSVVQDRDAAFNGRLQRLRTPRVDRAKALRDRYVAEYRTMIGLTGAAVDVTSRFRNMPRNSYGRPAKWRANREFLQAITCCVASGLYREIVLYDQERWHRAVFRSAAEPL